MLASLRAVHPEQKAPGMPVTEEQVDRAVGCLPTESAERRHEPAHAELESRPDEELEGRPRLRSVHRLVAWEVPILGWRVAALRYGVSLLLPVLAGLLTRALVRAF